MSKSNVDAVNTLERLIEQKRTELEQLEAALACLAKTIRPIEEVDEVARPYTGMGGLEAAQTWLTEVGKPQTTRELTDAMLSRGWRTASRNPVTSLHSTLKNAPQKFNRTKDGQWALTMWNLAGLRAETSPETNDEPKLVS